MGLCYTSGTTGNPKGALYSHRSMYLHTVGESQADRAWHHRSRCCTARRPTIPCHQLQGVALRLRDKQQADMIMPGPHLQGPPLAQLIDEYRVTIAAGVPTIWTGLYHQLKAKPRDISCIRALVVGGAAMPRSLIEGYERDLGVNVLHAWGMTELSPLGAVTRLSSQHRDLPDAQKWDIKATQGYTVGGVEIRIVNEMGEELPWDGTTMGEVQVRGPWVIKSYFKVEPAPESFTADGWFRTGDVATISPDGYMSITDRTKDLIKSGGE